MESDEPEAAGKRIDAAIAEFNRLYTEVNNRTTAQHNLLNFNLLTTGAIGTIALGDPSRHPLLLILPFSSSIFGLLYFDHSVAISLIVAYFRDELATAIRALTGWDRAFQWEEFVHKRSKSERGLRRGMVRFGIPILFAFLFAPAAVSVYLSTMLTDARLWIAWAIGIIAEALTAVVGLRATEAWKPDTRSKWL